MCDGGHEKDEDADVDDRLKNDEMVRDGGVVTVDDVLNCLGSSRRRIVLYCLQNKEVMGVEELAKQVGAWEEETPPKKVGEDLREHLEIQLVHRHLPKLADAALIEYDPRSHTARYRDPPQILQTILQLFAKLEGYETK